MESDGALGLFTWSAEKLGLMYLIYIDDGDSKSYQTVAKAQSYVPLQFIVKEECRCYFKSSKICRMEIDSVRLIKNW